MHHLSRDPIYNAIVGGIKDDISFTYDHQRFRACVILVYSGMDAMAWLSMPSDRKDVRKSDFVEWSNRYMRFPCVEQVTGLDFYGARCSMLHSYGVRSRISRAGGCRVVGYSDNAVPEVVYRPDISKELVMVSIRALIDAFFQGVDKFLVDTYTDRCKAEAAEPRLQELMMMFEFKRVP